MTGLQDPQRTEGLDTKAHGPTDCQWEWLRLGSGQTELLRSHRQILRLSDQSEKDEACGKGQTLATWLLPVKDTLLLLYYFVAIWDAASTVICQLQTLHVIKTHVECNWISEGLEYSCLFLYLTNVVWHLPLLFHPVAYPGNFFGWGGEGGSTNLVEDREQRGRGSGGGSPLVRGSGGSCNLVQEISFHIVKFS